MVAVRWQHPETVSAQWPRTAWVRWARVLPSVPAMLPLMMPRGSTPRTQQPISHWSAGIRCPWSKTGSMAVPCIETGTIHFPPVTSWSRVRLLPSASTPTGSPQTAPLPRQTGTPTELPSPDISTKCSPLPISDLHKITPLTGISERPGGVCISTTFLPTGFTSSSIWMRGSSSCPQISINDHRLRRSSNSVTA